MKYLFLSLSLLLSLNSFAAEDMKKPMKDMKMPMKGMKGMEKGKWPVAEVLAIRGKATYNGVQIKKGEELKKSGLIKVESRSFVKIKVKKWGNTITLGPRGEMELELEKPNNKKRYTLVGGACRWVTEKVNEKSKDVSKKGALFTNQASMGVRGTDYFVKVNKLLGETEIIVFDGKVEFTSITDDKDKAMISKNQWGGLGGRFGEKIGKVLDLTPTVINHFNKMLLLSQ